MAMIMEPWVEWSAESVQGGDSLPVPVPGAVSPYAIDPALPASGFGDRLPVPVRPQARVAGTTGASPLDDIYDTLWVVPGEINVGSLTATVSREVEVWNAYPGADKTLSAISVSGGEGINVTGPAAPHTFAPLESQVFAVEVTPAGPATIDARYDLTFDGVTNVPFWTVVGRRIIEWDVPPNWAAGYNETLSFKTEVLTAFDGTEQRLALRHRPRREIEFEPVFAGDAGRRAKRLLATWQNRNFAMADWARGVHCAGLPAGTTSVTLDEPIPELAVGDLIVLRGEGVSQAIEVAAIDGLEITLNSPVAASFPVGTRAYPGLVVHAAASLTDRRLTSDAGRTSMQFRQAYATGKLDAGSAATTWRGLEVFLARANWAQNVELDHVFNFTWLDNERGLFAFRTPEDSPKDVRKITVLSASRGEVRALTDFFKRCRGRRGEFYAPTWDLDLRVPDGEVLLSGGFTLPVSDTGEVDRVGQDLVYRNLYVRLTDGTELFRRVTSADLGPDGTPRLALDAGWPRNVKAHEVALICWMPRCRLASDQLTIEWKTDGLAEASIAMQTLEDPDE